MRVGGSVGSARPSPLHFPALPSQEGLQVLSGLCTAFCACPAPSPAPHPRSPNRLSSQAKALFGFSFRLIQKPRLMRAAAQGKMSLLNSPGFFKIKKEEEEETFSSSKCKSARNTVPNLLQLINLLPLMKCYLRRSCSWYTIIVTVVNKSIFPIQL